MEHRVDSVLHPSGRTFYLSSLASGMKVLSGELNLFLIRLEADRAAVFGIISQQFLSSLFSLVSLAMMFYYSALLGAMGLVMVLIYASVFSCFRASTCARLRFRRQPQDA